MRAFAMCLSCARSVARVGGFCQPCFRTKQHQPLPREQKRKQK